MTVHTFGEGLPGATWSADECDVPLLFPLTPFAWAGVEDRHGTVACHCARRLATARYMVGFLRSSGSVALPLMNLYIMPFLNLANRSGARPCCMSSSWFWVSRCRSINTCVPLPYALSKTASWSISSFETPGFLFMAFKSVLVMPSVNRTNSMLAPGSFHSGRSSVTSCRAEASELLLSYSSEMNRTWPTTPLVSPLCVTGGIVGCVSESAYWGRR